MFDPAFLAGEFLDEIQVMALGEDGVHAVEFGNIACEEHETRRSSAWVCLNHGEAAGDGMMRGTTLI